MVTAALLYDARSFTRIKGNIISNPVREGKLIVYSDLSKLFTGVTPRLGYTKSAIQLEWIGDQKLGIRIYS